MIDAREKFDKPIDYVDLYAREKFSHVTYDPLRYMPYTEGNKMTRQEAIKLLLKAMPDGNNDYEERFIRRIEALGLIKFDEEKKIDYEMIKAINITRCNCSNVDFADGLAKLGYKIVKA